MNEHFRVSGIVAGGQMSQTDEIINLFNDLSLDDIQRVLAKCGQTHENQRECPMFLMAALNQHHEMIKFLLENYRDAIDLEQTGTIEFHNYLIEGATALWCAAGSGCIKTVMALVEAGANVNHLTVGRSTPLRAACFEGNFSIVKYLIEKGADVNLCNNFHNTCLMITAFRGHLDIVRYLIDQGASINSQACCGATALHFTADTGNLAMVRLLVEYGKADLSVKNNCGLTPLMLAAERCQDAIVDYLLDRTLDRQTRIDAMELIGASFANDKERYDPIKAYAYLERAMKARWDSRDSLIQKTRLKPIPAYNNHIETETIQELELLKDSLQDLFMEGLTIRERILGQQNPELTHCIIYRGAVFADEGNFDACAKLWLYSLSLKHASKASSSKEILRFCQFFCEILMMRQKVEFNYLNDVLLAAAAEFDLLKDRYKEPMSPDDRAIFLEESDVNIHNFLYLVAIFARIMKTLKEEEVLSALQCIHKVVAGVEPRTTKKRETMLHLAVDSTTKLDDFHINGILRFPCPLTTRVLIDTHANVGATDSEGNTPLHIIAGYERWIEDFISLHSIINQLTEAGAHVDAVNENNKTPLDIAGVSVTATILKINQKISLKCLAAQNIIRHRIAYIGIVPDTLKSFIELHGIPNTTKTNVSSTSPGTSEYPTVSST